MTKKKNKDNQLSKAFGAKYSICLIRKKFPTLFAQNTVAVQPMGKPSNRANMFNMIWGIGDPLTDKIKDLIYSIRTKNQALLNAKHKHKLVRKHCHNILRGKKMPFYDYKCNKCGHIHEEQHSILISPNIKCPKCKERCTRMMPKDMNFILKGDDWAGKRDKKK